MRSVAGIDNSVALGNQSQTQAVTTTTVDTTVQGDPDNTYTSTTTTTSGTGTGSVAIGDQARANGDNNIAMGTGATTELVDTTLDMSTTDGVSTLVSTTTVSPAHDAIAIGTYARANGDGAVVIGNGAVAEARVKEVLSGFGGDYVYDHVAPAANATVIGNYAMAQGTNDVVIGAGAMTMGDSVIQLLDPVTGEWVNSRCSRTRTPRSSVRRRPRRAAGERRWVIARSPTATRALRWAPSPSP